MEHRQHRSTCTQQPLDALYAPFMLLDPVLQLGQSPGLSYSAALCGSEPLKIARTLNTPSICSGMLDVSDAGLAVPVRRGRVVVTATNGTVLFTGYIATDPEAVYAGTGLKGSVYRYAFSAVSDEWLLDKQSVPLSGAGLAQSGGLLLTTLTDRVDAGLFTTTGVTNGLPVGVYEPSFTIVRTPIATLSFHLCCKKKKAQPLGHAYV